MKMFFIKIHFELITRQIHSNDCPRSHHGFLSYKLHGCPTFGVTVVLQFDSAAGFQDIGTTGHVITSDRIQLSPSTSAGFDAVGYHEDEHEEHHDANDDSA